MSQRVWHEEDEHGEEEKKEAGRQSVLDREVRVKRQTVLRALRVDADRVARAVNVNRGEMEKQRPDDNKRQQVMQGEKPVERRIVNRKAAPQPRHDMIADDREGGEQVCDHRRPPEAHLAPGQDVTHEGGRHHENQDDHAQQPGHLPRRLVGAVVERPEDVDVGDDEEERGAVGMQVAQQPAVVHVPHDALDGIERIFGVGGVMHGKEYAGQDHQHERDHRLGAEAPHVVAVLRHRVFDIFVMHHAEDRQSLVDPANQRIL